jgi:predicted dehydrogenase
MRASKSKEKVRVGIIGTGFGRIALKPAFDSVEGCTVMGICSGHNWRHFLQREDLDAVAIATPPDIQYQIAKAAIQKNLHVFAEKPLAANLKQARELLSLAKKKKIVHAIDFMFPDIAAWQKAKQILTKEQYGKLMRIETNWEWLSGELKYNRSTWRSDRTRGGGALAFYFSHGLHYLEYFGGPIKSVHARFAYASKKRAEVGVDLNLSFKSGAKGLVHVSSNSRNRTAHRLVFTCERGVIVLENKDAIVDRFSIRVIDARGERVIKVKKDAGPRGADERVKVVRKLSARFIHAIKSKDAMHPSFSEGARVQELIERARKGA